MFSCQHIITVIQEKTLELLQKKGKQCKFVGGCLYVQKPEHCSHYPTRWPKARRRGGTVESDGPVTLCGPRVTDSTSSSTVLTAAFVYERQTSVIEMLWKPNDIPQNLTVIKWKVAAWQILCGKLCLDKAVAVLDNIAVVIALALQQTAMMTVV